MTWKETAYLQKLDFLEWLAKVNPALPARFHSNIDVAMIRQRKMTVNNSGGISSGERATLILLLKKYYEEIKK